MPERTLRSDWSRPLPLVIPEVMTLTELPDVRALIERHLPAHFRGKTTWRHAAAELQKASLNGDTADVLVALRIALSLEGVEYLPR